MLVTLINNIKSSYLEDSFLHMFELLYVTMNNKLLIFAIFLLLWLFCVLLVANEHDFIWQNIFNSLIKSACFSFMQI